MQQALAPNPDYWRTRPRAPAPGTALGPLDQIADNDAREFVFGKGRSAFSMFIVRKQQSVWGYLNICPHVSLPLNFRAGQFMNDAGDRIRCTMHYAEFRIEDGFCIAGAAEKCFLEPVPVENRQGMLFIGGEDKATGNHHQLEGNR